MAAVDTLDPREAAAEEFGYFLGYPVRPAVDQPLYSPYDQALRVIGPMGSGKTFRFLAQVIRKAPGPVVATSTKPDTIELTYGARLRRGPVVSFDPQGICPGVEPFRWSPIHGAEDTRVADLRAGAFVAGGGGGGNTRTDQAAEFYRGQAADVLAAFWHAAALDGASLRDVLKWAARFSDPAPRQILDHHPGAGPGWSDMLTAAITGDERTVGNTRATLSRALACFKHAAVVDAIDVAPDRATDVEAMFDACGTVYLLGKESPYSSVSSLITAINEDVLDRAEQHANTKPARRLDPPLLGAIDEAPNIAPLPSLRQRVADGRGRGLCMIYLVQGWASAEARFGRDTADELASFTNNTLVFGGAGDPDFLEKMEKLCGQLKVFRTQSSSAAQKGGRASRSVSEDWEPVMRAHQIRQLNVQSGEALLLSSSLPPVVTRLPMLTEDPDWPQIQQEVQQVRAMADHARVTASEERRRYLEANAAAWKRKDRRGGRVELGKDGER